MDASIPLHEVQSLGVRTRVQVPHISGLDMRRQLVQILSAGFVVMNRRLSPSSNSIKCTLNFSCFYVPMSPCLFYLHDALRLCRINSSDGLPLKRHRRFSCFMLSAPGNSGMRPISSATMQPTAHISTAEVYLCQPTSTSGARYQRVVTYSVIASILESLLSL